MHKHGVFLFCVILMVTSLACSTRQLAVREMAGIMDTGVAAFENDGDLEMLGQAFPATIKLVEVFLASDPDNADLKLMLARLYASYAFAFLEPLLEIDYFAIAQDPRLERFVGAKDPALALARARDYYEKGEGFALDALEKRRPGSREQLKTREGQAGFFSALTAEDVPAVFWWAFNLGARINLERSSVALLASAHLAETAMRRVADLDPAYQNAGAHLFLMAYYGSRPPMMGGNPGAAADHHEALIGIVGEDFLLGSVYYGRYVLQPAQDRGGFTAIMAHAAEAPSAERYRFYNAIAAVRAQIYLIAADDLFTEEEAP